MLVPQLIEEWPEVALLFDAPIMSSICRDEVTSWPPPWRNEWSRRVVEKMDAGMGWEEAEEAAYGEMVALRASPRPVAGAKRTREPVAMPPIARRKPTKSVREGMPGLFDGMDDGASTTYQTGEM